MAQNLKTVVLFTLPSYARLLPSDGKKSHTTKAKSKKLKAESVVLKNNLRGQDFRIVTVRKLLPEGHSMILWKILCKAIILTIILLNDQSIGLFGI